MKEARRMHSDMQTSSNKSLMQEERRKNKFLKFIRIICTSLNVRAIKITLETLDSTNS